jgi:hypothetical protein
MWYVGHLFVFTLLLCSGIGIFSSLLKLCCEAVHIVLCHMILVCHILEFDFVFILGCPFKSVKSEFAVCVSVGKIF